MDWLSKGLGMEKHPAMVRNSVLLQSFDTIREVQKQLAELVATKPTPAILASQISLWSVLLAEVGTIRACLERGSIGKKIGAESELESSEHYSSWQVSTLPTMPQTLGNSESLVSPKNHRRKSDVL